MCQLYFQESESMVEKSEHVSIFLSFPWHLVHFSSVSQSCLILHDTMDCSTPGFAVHYQLLEHAQKSGSFPMSQFFASGGQSIGASASASVLPMNIQDRFPLGGLVGSLWSPRDSQESSPTPQFKNINSSVLSFLYSPNFTSIYDHWKNHSLD